MYNAKNWKWFIDIHCVQNAREDKKTFTVDREIRKSANTCKWMNEWKACWGKGWKKLQSCMLAQLIGHMCNRCHLSAAIVYIASLFLMVLFIHIHNWSNCRRKEFLYCSQLDSFLSICSFSPPKNQWHEMFALHANIAGYRILWQISYPARSTTQNMN